MIVFTLIDPDGEQKEGSGKAGVRAVPSELSSFPRSPFSQPHHRDRSEGLQEVNGALEVCLAGK